MLAVADRERGGYLVWQKQSKTLVLRKGLNSILPRPEECKTGA
jgi:hypothetical protein